MMKTSNTFQLLCMIVCANLGGLLAYDTFTDFVRGFHQRRMYYIRDLKGDPVLDSSSASEVDIGDQVMIHRCLDNYTVEPGERVQLENTGNQILGYLKRYMRCAFKSYNEDNDKDVLKCRPKCKQLNSFDDEYKSTYDKFGFRIGMYDIELENQGRTQIKTAPKDKDDSGCNDNRGKRNPNTAKFGKSIATTQSVSMQLDASNKVSYGNGLDVDVSWSVGFLGIWSAGQSYSGSYMVTDTDSTASSSKTTESIMKEVSIEMEWTENPKTAITSRIYRQNTMGKRKFTAWMEVQGWLGQVTHLSGRKVFQVLPLGDFAFYHQDLGVRRLNANSFLFPVVGYLESEVTEYYFKLKEGKRCS